MSPNNTLQVLQDGTTAPYYVTPSLKLGMPLFLEKQPLYEHSDNVRTKAVLSSTYLEDNSKEDDNQYRWEDTYKSLTAYMEKHTKGFVKVILTRKKEYGRLFPKGNGSFCFMRKKLRNTIMNGEYLDFDLHNCHVSILVDILRNHFPDEDWSSLEAIRDRREELCAHYHVPKQHWCSMLNGKRADLPGDNFIDGLKICIKRARFFIIQRNPQLYKQVKSKLSAEDMWNVDGKFMSAYLSEIETRLISDLVELCFRETDLLKYKGKSAVYSYEFDGFKLLKQNVEAFGGVDVLLETLNGRIREKWGFANVTMVCKPMEEGYDIEEYLKEAREELANEEEEHLKKRAKTGEAEKEEHDEVYLETKRDFEDTTSEEFHFKLKNPFSFVRVRKGVIQPFMRARLLDFYENHPVKGFIRQWVADSSILTYETMDMLPPPLICSPDIFNLYGGLAIERDTMNVNLMDLSAEELESAKRGVELILDHMRNQVGGEEVAVKYLLDWVALKIQQPGRRADVGLVFISDQGSGKNTLWDYIGETLLGQQYYYLSCESSRLFSRFSEGLRNKLLIVFNEVSAKQTVEHSETLKSRITDATVDYECKGVQPVTLRNCANWVFLSNKQYVVKVEATDRRYAFFHSVNDHCNDRENYFIPLLKAMKDPVVNKMLYNILMERDVTKFDPVGDRPLTQAYRDAKQQSMPAIDRFVLDYLHENHLLEMEDVIGEDGQPLRDEEGNVLRRYFKKVNVASGTLHTAFLKYTRGKGWDEWNTTKFGIHIIKCIGKRDGGKELMVYRNNGKFYILDAPWIMEKMKKNGYVEEGDTAPAPQYVNLPTIDNTDIYTHF